MTHALSIIGPFVFGFLLGGFAAYYYFKLALNVQWVRLKIFNIWAGAWPADWGEVCPLCQYREKLEREMQAMVAESAADFHTRYCGSNCDCPEDIKTQTTKVP